MSDIVLFLIIRKAISIHKIKNSTQANTWPVMKTAFYIYTFLERNYNNQILRLEQFNMNKFPWQH